MNNEEIKFYIFTGYGVKKMSVVVDHFKDILTRADIEKSDVLDEWSQLKAMSFEK